MKMREVLAVKNSISYMTVVALLSAVFLCPAVGAARSASATTAHSRLPAFSRVVSFDELMRMPRAKRVAYLRGLRKMMVAIEKLPSKLRASNYDAAEFSRMAALLSLFENEAFAAGDMPTVTAKGNMLCGSGWSSLYAGSFGSSSQDSTLYVCVATKEKNDAKPSPQSETCPGNQIAVKQQPDGTFYCASYASFLALNPRVQISARWVKHMSVLDSLDKAFKGKYATGQEMKTRREAQAAAPPKPVASGAPADAEAARKAALTRGAPPVVPPKAPVIPAAPATGVAGSRARSGDPVGTGTTSPAAVTTAPVPAADPAPVSKPAAVVAPPPAATTSDDDRIEVTNATEEAAAIVVTPSGKTAASPATADKCDPDAEKTCDPGEIENARKKYATQSDKLSCIYAGGISTYNEGVKRAYNCAAPTKFSFSKGGAADYSCPTGKIICNPLVFGLEADGKTPLCVDKGGSATSSCDDAVPDDGKSPLDQTHSGLKEAWNEFADGLHAICFGDETVKTLHCAECDIIQKRLFALNVASRDVKTCGDAIKYQDANCDKDGKCSRPGSSTDDGSKRAPVRGGARSVSSDGAAPVPAEPKSVFDQKSSRPK